MPPDASHPSQSERAITHLVILRACAADPEGENAEAKLGMFAEPSAERLGELRDDITTLYRESFGAEPERVGVAVLPWAGELDD